MHSDVVPPDDAREARRLLSASDPEVRRLVVRALRKSPPEIAESVLLEVLGDEEWRVRKEAVALAQGLKGRAVPILLGALDASPDQVSLRNAAVDALSSMGPLAAPAVIEVLSSGVLDANGRKFAIEVLGSAPRALSVVIQSLDDPDPNVQAAAAEAIGRMGGDEAIPALLRVLARGDRILQLTAMHGLERLEAQVPFELLLPRLQDRMLWGPTLSLLGRCGDVRAGAPLLTALDDRSRTLADTALLALARLCLDVGTAALEGLTLNTSARARILELSKYGDRESRAAALAVVARVDGTAAIDVLVDALGDPELVEIAENELAELGDRALPGLLDLVRNHDARRALILGLLPRWAASRPVVVDVLRIALRDPDPDVATHAISALLAVSDDLLGPDDVQVLLRLAAPRANARSDSARRLAASALHALRVLARGHARTIRRCLAELPSDDETAPVACALLSVIGNADDVEWLSRAVSASSAATRRAAAEALGHIGGRSGAEHLRFTLADEAVEVVHEAIRALGRVRDENDESAGVLTLLSLLESESLGGDGRLAATVRALGATGDSRAVPPLLRLIDEADPLIASTAIDALAELGSSELGHAVRRALLHPSALVRRAALSVIESECLSGAEALDLLEETLNDGDASIRLRATELLASSLGTLRPLTLQGPSSIRNHSLPAGPISRSGEPNDGQNWLRTERLAHYAERETDPEVRAIMERILVSRGRSA